MVFNNYLLFEILYIFLLSKLNKPNFSMKKHTKAQLFKKVGLFLHFTCITFKKVGLFSALQSSQKPDFYELNLHPKSRAFFHRFPKSWACFLKI